jgi:hypothetical protein
VVLVLTVDEIRALGRITGGWLPRYVAEDDEEDLRVDLAALRGLAARDLLVWRAERVDSEHVTLDPALQAALEPFRDPATVVEVDLVTAGQATWFAASRAGDIAGTGLLAWHGTGLVTIELVGDGIAETVARLCQLTPTEPLTTTGVELVVHPDAQIDADELALAGAHDEAVAALVAAGATHTAARAWVAAVASCRRSVGVSVAHRFGTRYEAGELRWLEAGDGTAWRATGGSDGLSVVAPVDPGELYRSLVELFASARVGGSQACPVR